MAGEQDGEVGSVMEEVEVKHAIAVAVAVVVSSIQDAVPAHPQLSEYRQALNYAINDAIVALPLDVARLVKEELRAVQQTRLTIERDWRNGPAPLPLSWETIDPMSVYIQQDARGIKRVVEIAQDGRLIEHKRPEVEA